MADCVDCGGKIRFWDRLQGGTCESCRTARQEAFSALQIEYARASKNGFDGDLSRITELEAATRLPEKELVNGRCYAFGQWAERIDTRGFNASDVVEATRVLEFMQGLGQPSEEQSATAVSFIVAKFADAGIAFDFGLVELPLWKHEVPVFEIAARLLRSDVEVTVDQRGSSYTTNERRVLKQVDNGNLTITSERLVFVGQYTSQEVHRDQFLDLASDGNDLQVFLRYRGDPLIFRTIAPAAHLQPMVAFMARGELNDPQTAGEAWERIKDLGRTVKLIRRESRRSTD